MIRENWRLAKKLDAKVRTFAPIIVRGQEDEGVKLWQFGKEVYQEFLNMAADEEIGDFTDIAEGRDIKLTTVGPEVTGTPYNKTSIGPSLKTTPLADTEDIVKTCLNDQADPMKVFKPLSYDEMKRHCKNGYHQKMKKKKIQLYLNLQFHLIAMRKNLIIH
jgi:hypothetical protein